MATKLPDAPQLDTSTPVKEPDALTLPGTPVAAPEPKPVDLTAIDFATPFGEQETVFLPDGRKATTVEESLGIAARAARFLKSTAGQPAWSRKRKVVRAHEVLGISLEQAEAQFDELATRAERVSARPTGARVRDFSTYFFGLYSDKLPAGVVKTEADLSAYSQFLEDGGRLVRAATSAVDTAGKWFGKVLSDPDVAAWRPPFLEEADKEFFAQQHEEAKRKFEESAARLDELTSTATLAKPAERPVTLYRQATSTAEAAKFKWEELEAQRRTAKAHWDRAHALVDGADGNALAEYDYAIAATPPLPGTLGEGGDSVQDLISDVQQVGSSMVSVVEDAAAVKTAGVGVAVAGTAKVVEKVAGRMPGVPSKLAKYAAKTVGLATKSSVFVPMFVSSYHQEGGNFLANTRGSELAKKDPAAHLAGAVAYAAVSSFIDSVDDVVTYAAGMGLKPKDLAEDTLRATLKRAAMTKVLKEFSTNPRGAVATFFGEVARAAGTGALSNGTEESSQQFTENLVALMQDRMANPANEAMLDKFTDNLFQSGVRGATGGTVSTGAFAGVRVAAMGMLTSQAEQAFAAREALRVADLLGDKARKSDTTPLTRGDKALLRDIRRGVALGSGTLYVNPDHVARAVTEAAAAQGVSESNIIQRAGLQVLDPETKADGAAPMAVSITDAATKWADAGLLKTSLLDNFSSDLGGTTVANAAAKMRAEAKLAEEDAKRAALAAKAEEDTRILIDEVSKMTQEEQQAFIYGDEVSQQLSVQAFEDVADRLAADGHEIITISYQGQKVANDLTNHGDADVMFRHVAAAAAKVTPWVFKVGGDIYAAVKGDAVQKAEAMRAAAAAALPGKAGAIASTGSFQIVEGKVDFRGTLDALTGVHRAKANALRDERVWAERGHLPVELLAEEALTSGLFGTSLGSERQSARDKTAKSSRARFAREISASAAAWSGEAAPVPQMLRESWNPDPQDVVRQVKRVLIDESTGLLTGKARALLQKRAPHAHTVAVDMRGLFFFAQMGRAQGDYVLRLFGAMTGLAGGPEFRVTRLHGDEYAASSNDPEALAKFVERWQKLANGLQFKVTDAKGTYEFDGLYFFSEQGKGDYDSVDRTGNTRKQELDKKSAEIHQRNQAILAKAEEDNRDVRPEELTPLLPDSRAFVERRLALAIAGERPGPGDPGFDARRGTDRLDEATALAGRDRGQTLDGLAEALVAAKVDEATGNLRRRARELDQEFRRERAETSTPETLDRLLAQARVLVDALIEDVRWRVATSTIRTPDDAGGLDAGAFLKNISERAEVVSGTAFKVYEGAVKRLRSALKEARAAISDQVINPYIADRWKADPLYRLHGLLLKGEDRSADGSKRDISGLKLDAADAKARLPAAVVKALRAAGRLTTDGGTKVEAFAHLAGVAQEWGGDLSALTPEQWGDVLDPPTARQAGAKRLDVVAAQLAEVQFLEGLIDESHLGLRLPTSWFLAEIRALKSTKQQGPGGSPVLSLKRAATKLVAAMRRGDLHLKAIERLEQAAGERALREAARGNLEAARVARQEQLTYLYVARNADKAKGVHLKVHKKLRALAKGPALKEMSRGSQAATDFVGHVLNKFDMARGKFPPEAVGALNETLEEITRAAGYVELPVDVDLLERTLRDESIDSPADLTTEQAENLLNALNAAQAFSNKMASALSEILRSERNDLINRETVAAMGRNYVHRYGDADPAGRGTKAQVEHFFRTAAPRLAQSGRAVQNILARLSPTLEDAIMGRVVAAEDQRTELLKQVVGGYLKLLEDRPGVAESLLDEIPLAHIRTYLPARSDDFRARSVFRREWAISLALNAGNRGNLYWLLTQEGWSYEQVAQFLDATLTPAEWEFVEKSWAFMNEKVYPLVREHHRRRNGYDPEKVDAVPMFVPSLGRSVSGGYMPIRFDPTMWAAYRTENPDQLSDLHGQQHQGMVGVARGVVKGRREFMTTKEVLDFDPLATPQRQVLPLNLSLQVLPFHLEEVTHYLAFEEPVLDLWTLTQDPEFQRLVNLYSGPGGMAQITDWVRYLARGDVDAWPAAIQAAGQAITISTTAFTAAAVGMRLPIAAADLVNVLLPVILENATLGSADPQMTYSGQALATELARNLNHFGDRYRTMREKSAAFRAVVDDLELEQIRFLGARLMAGRVKETREEWLKRVQWHVYDYVTRAIATTVWHTKIADAKLKDPNVTQEAAQAEADRFLLNFMVSHKGAFKSAALRRWEALGGFTRFMSFFFKVVGDVTDTALHPLAVNMVKADGTLRQRAGVWTANGAKLIAASVAAYSLLNLLGEILVGAGPKDEEPEWWALRKLALAPLYRFPVVGRMAEVPVNAAFGAPFSPRTVPALAFMQLIVKDMEKAWDPDAPIDDRFWATVEAVAAARGLPARAIKTTGAFVWDYATGDVEIPTPFVEGVMFDAREHQFGTNPFSIWSR